MPLYLSDDLPAFSHLKWEGCNVHSFHKGDKRQPIEVLFINQMPALTKTSTDVQWGRLLAATPHSLRITQAQPGDTIDWPRYDGLLMTGANCEHKKPQQIPTWKSLQEILDLSKQLTSSLFVCWASQIALEHDYGIKRHINKTKLFGICAQQLVEPRHSLLAHIPDFVDRRDPDHEIYVTPRYNSEFASELYKELKELDKEQWRTEPKEIYAVPVSRYGYTDENEVRSRTKTLEIIFSSPETHAGLLCSESGDRIYSNNHPEYDRETLGREYIRDLNKDDQPLREYYYLLKQMHDTTTPPWRPIGQTIVAHWARKLATGREDYHI